jgi:hypothetical protein
LAHAFGELIGNTDMHNGNLGLWLEDTLPMRIAPAYDMLPMLWAPSHQGEMVAREFTPAPPVPAAQDAWREAAIWAGEFWDRVCGDSRISPEFHAFCAEAKATVARLRAFVEISF